MVALVLLPGMHGSGELFAQFVAALGPDHEPIMVTYPQDQALGYAELEQLVRSRLPLDRPFALLGESFSGPIALSIAATSPPGLRALILCGSFAKNPVPLLAWLRHAGGVLWVWRRVAPLAIGAVLGRFWTAPLRDAIVRAVERLPPEVVRARILTTLGTDVTALLPKITVPVLYLQASRDRLVPRAAASLILRSLSTTQVVVLEAPHFVLQAAPLAAAREVGAFLRRITNEEPHEPSHQA